MYILTYKAKRKNARRHIWGRYNSIDECIVNANNSNYIFTVYNNKWEYVQEVKKKITTV